ncbi:MAG: hypothetical protein JW840_03535 [Candidatus Thermoplasmatota archaeon]|nr:hypothetical protein [Candidatus Thermoplasmatota archaeon]
MRKTLVFFFIISLLCSPFASIGGLGFATEEHIAQTALMQNNQEEILPKEMNAEPSIRIVSPAAGYLYLFKIQPIKMTFASLFGLKYAVVVGRSINLETEYNDIHHVKFVAKRMITGWETVRYDYRTLDGLAADLSITSGIYTLSVFAYNETGQELAHDSINVLYIKVGREDFGVWVNTKYNGGETITKPLQLGITDFASMLNTGESKQFSISLQNNDDTTIDLRFIRTKIMDNTEKVVETKCNIITTCDTSKEHEVSVEIRFPFIMLDGGQPQEDKNPYFSAKVGYQSQSGQGGANHVNTTFYVGRENISDPRVFRLSVKPETIESGSKLTFFTTYCTVDSTGNEIFQRTYAIDFEPAIELTITSIPRQAKISYEFGRSAGVNTKISLRAEGGVLDDIVQSFRIDPLPSYMNFDLTLIGSREFLYECDRSYNVSYAIDSEQNGNLVTFQVLQLPQQIHATWGLNLSTLGDLAASSFAELDMSEDVKRLSLSFFGHDRPFISLDNFPKKLRYDCSVDLVKGTGEITILRQSTEPRTLNISLAYEDLTVTKSFDLKNTLLSIKWKIDLLNGTGFFDITRDSETIVTLTTTIQYKSWTFTKELELKNNHLELIWDINREQRTGRIILSREAAGGAPTLSFSIAHDGWVLQDTLEFNNEYLELLWQLPTSTGNPHAQIGLITRGENMFYNTISVVDNSVQLLQLGFGIQTDDHFLLSWDYINGHISNFTWSGKLFRLTDVNIAVNLAGEVFTVSADLSVGEGGSVELQFNKDVSVTFVDAMSDTFKIHGNVSIDATRRLQLSWELGENGHFTIYTFGQPIGDQFSLEFGYDPQHTGNYKYGFRLLGQNFIYITRTIQWYSENGDLLRIWILGDLPIPGDWSIQLLWNGEWYPVPWAAQPQG